MSRQTIIERLGHLGDGIAPGPVFVPGTLPGEVVEGEVSDGRMAAPKIVTPSPDRVRAPCPHFRACGGCVLQHASDGFVASWKAGVVQQALRAQRITAEIVAVHSSPANSRRRAVLSGRRTKKGATVGLHARASDAIVEIPDCLLMDPAIMGLIPALKALTAELGSRKGELSFAVTVSEGGLDLAVRDGKGLDGPKRIRLAEIATTNDLARLVWDDEVIVTRRPPVQRFGRTAVVPTPGAFLQATPQGEAALLDAVNRAVAKAKAVADLFAGCGTFALPLAENAEVHAVEGSAEMLKALENGWRRAERLHRVTTEARDLFRRPLMPDELKKYDAVVIDPPRAGAEAQTEQLADSAVPVIAAVSCNPVTFARDAKVLIDAGFNLDWIEVVDQFRWSPHIELVARMSRTR
ncbi:MAG: class I SAM-dependent RNA methyltransferase [Paracoccaceae bacterium]|nr:class I SAM-dependent RNA methyltransferase [Paracoccaceae bacterium]